MQDERSRQINQRGVSRRSIRLGQGISRPITRSQRLLNMANTNTPRSNMQSRQFMFIEQDANRGTTGEAIRVHVMRESHRARRQLRGLMQSNESHGQMTIFSATQPEQGALSGSHCEAIEESEENEEPTSRSRSSSQQPSNTVADLQNLADQRRDSMLNYTSANVIAATPSFSVLEKLPANIIELCGGDSAALHALLALITCIQNSIGVLQAAEFESFALEILRSRLAEAGQGFELSDQTILTVLLLSQLERARHNEETAGFHEAALRRMIRARGGFDNLANTNGSLVALLRDFGVTQVEQ